jgi:aminoglycoside phosphotransferase (APT) family kinase protein
VGYLTATYAQPGDEADAEGETPIFALNAVTTREGFPTRDELIARYEERSGRSMSDVRWYQTLALWKSAVFLEGSYKRLLAGTTDDPFFKLLDEGVPAIARRALATAHAS